MKMDTFVTVRHFNQNVNFMRHIQIVQTRSDAAERGVSSEQILQCFYKMQFKTNEIVNHYPT